MKPGEVFSQVAQQVAHMFGKVVWLRRMLGESPGNPLDVATASGPNFASRAGVGPPLDLPVWQGTGLPWMRLIHVVLLITLITAVWLGTLTIPQSAAMGIVALLAGYVALLSVGPRRIALLRKQDLILVLDLLVVTSLLLVSGDLNSPFLYLYYLIILEAAIRMNLRQALAAALAIAALIILIWLRMGMAEVLRDAGFRLGAFIAGGFMLALFLGMLVQENQARRAQTLWTQLLNRRLDEATHQLEVQLDELQFYNDLAAQLSGELRTDGVADILLRFFLKAIGLSRGLAYVIGDDGAARVAAQRVVWAVDGEHPAPELALPDNATGGEPIVLPYPQGSTLPGAMAVCLPLVRGGSTRAWVCGLADEPPPEEASTRRLLQGIAAQGAVALEAAILYEEVQHMMRTDPMRALFSWAGLEKLVTTEIERCRTLLLVFSIAEIQLENYGGSRADAADRDLALRRAVNLMQVSLRRVDVISYDGAGRFAILLPRMPKVRAMELVQTLVGKLENDPVASRLLMVDRLVLAAGVVTFPEDGTTASSLFAGVEGLLVMGPSRPARVQVPAS